MFSHNGASRAESYQTTLRAVEFERWRHQSAAAPRVARGSEVCCPPFPCYASKRKEKVEYLYSANLYTMYISKRSGMDHLQIRHACLSFVSIYQMALPLTELADIQLQLTTHLST